MRGSQETDRDALGGLPRRSLRPDAAGAQPANDQGSFISFASIDLLWKVITPKRLDILRALAGARTLSIREVARRVGRDVKAVHGDVRRLIDAGIVEAAPSGVRFGYDAVHVDFTLDAA